jgi:hypothetical protein
MQCGFPKGGEPDFTTYDCEVRDDSVYQFKCRHGHDNVVVVQEDKFEVLFEIGLNAIVDGYYREAVSSITSSLERFYEFFVRVIAHKFKIPPDVFDLAWKAVRNQSERQLGGFIVAHLLNTGVAPKLLDTKSVAFRNDVIHKGRIPLYAEAIEYANTVLSLINPALLDMKKSMGQEVNDIVMARMKALHARLDPKLQRALMSIGATVSVAVAATEPHVTKVEDRLQRLARRKYKA